MVLRWTQKHTHIEHLLVGCLIERVSFRQVGSRARLDPLATSSNSACNIPAENPNLHGFNVLVSFHISALASNLITLDTGVFR